MTLVRHTGHLRDRYTLLARAPLRTAGLKRKFESELRRRPVDNIIVVGALRQCRPGLFEEFPNCFAGTKQLPIKRLQFVQRIIWCSLL
jgi:hypothetical protein